MLKFNIAPLAEGFGLLIQEIISVFLPVIRLFSAMYLPIPLAGPYMLGLGWNRNIYSLEIVTLYIQKFSHCVFKSNLTKILKLHEYLGNWVSIK